MECIILILLKKSTRIIYGASANVTKREQLSKNAYNNKLHRNLAMI